MLRFYGLEIKETSNRQFRSTKYLHGFAVTVAIALSFSITVGAAEPPSKHSAKGRTTQSIQQRISSIEGGFAPISLSPNEPPVKLSLQELMRVSNVTQLSVAVIDNYKIDWAKGYGLTDTGAPVNTGTLFPACSVTKAISALAALRLVEEGKLRLDEDVNLNLKSWKVPENEYTKVQKVTLRRILTHTSGTIDRGFPGYVLGQPTPTLLQVLNGEQPANTKPVQVTYVPGTRQNYSGSGFLILQQLMIDATSEPYQNTVKQLVFDKLRLKNSTFDPQLSLSRAASGRDRNGEQLERRFGPELAVGGLWTTPSDLAGIAIDVALSKNGKLGRILSRPTVQEMLRVQVNPQIEGGPAGGPETQTGLAWFLGEESDPLRFEHSGVNIGFAAKVIMWDSGHGVVIMANNWSFETEVLMRYVINDVAESYGWTYRVPTHTTWPYADTVLLAAAKLRGPQAAIAKYYELKQLSSEQEHKMGGPRVVWASNPPDYPPNEWDLFGLAQSIADSKHVQDAIEIMKTEVQEYPKWPPAYRYLGELYTRAGQKQLAIQTYETLLTLIPTDEQATESLRKLRE